ncbi:MAG: class I SAM-dependent methyltransferase [Spirochaetes bacterium]|nr:class I SAM-dependent methyltransferase [Spirochaetota bacterium]
MKEKWGLHGVGNYSLGRNYNFWLYKLQKAVLYRQIKPLFSDRSKKEVLDIGSGTGYFVQFWRSLKVKSIMATDISDYAVMQIKKKFPDVHSFQMDISKELPKTILKKKYHFISAVAVLFHINNDKMYLKALKNLYKLLQPGGYLFFSENFLHHGPLHGGYQVNRTLSVIKRLVIKAGFQIKSRVPLFILMNYPVDLKSNIIKKGWQKLTWPVRKFHFLGALAGAILYPLDLLLTRWIKEGPSTELMVCKKPGYLKKTGK